MRRAAGEFAEIEEGAGRGPRALAGALFVHGLLAHLAETRSAGIDRAARTRRLLTVLERPRRARRRRLGAAAAALLAAAVLGGRFVLGRGEIHAELLERALAESSAGLHVYGGEFSYRRAGGALETRPFRLLLGPGGRFVLTVERRGRRIRVGSDGRRLWFGGGRGRPVEVPFADPSKLPLVDLGPELSYCRLAPWLRAFKAEGSRFEVEELAAGGDEPARVRLTGRLRPRGAAPGRPPRPNSVFTLTVERASGRLLELHLRADPPPRRGFVALRLQHRGSFPAGRAAMRAFAPERLRPPPLFTAAALALALAREIRSRRR